MRPFLRPHPCFLLLALGAPVSAQIPFNYSNGQNYGQIMDVTRELHVAIGTATQSGVIIDRDGNPGSVIKTGDGTLILANALNEYTGDTIIRGGALEVGDPNNINGDPLSPLGVISFEGGALRFSAYNSLDYSARFSTAAGQQYRVDTNGQDITFASAIASVGGMFTKLGTGTLTLSGANSFDGGVTVQTGVLHLGSAGALGSTGPIAFTGGTLRYSAANNLDYSARFSTAAAQQIRIDTNGQNVTFASDITSVGGTFTKFGGGDLTLSGANSFDGGATFHGGVIQLDSAGALGSAGPITLAGATLRYSPANNLDYSGRLSAAIGQQYRIDTNGQSVTFATGLASSGAGLVKSGAGTLTLASDNSYGGTTIAEGTLQIGNGGFSGSVGGDITNHGALIFNRADTFNVGLLISGPGSVTKAGPGTMVFQGDHTYTGGTTLADGVLEIHSSGALGSAGAISFGGGTLRYADGAPLTDYSGRFATTPGQQYRIQTGFGFAGLTYATALTSPGGSLYKSGAETLILTADSTYTGFTTVAEGRLQLGDGGTTGRVVGPIDLAAGAWLDIKRGGILSFSQPITGAGNVSIDGGATVGFGAANTFTGSTDVINGTLHLLGGASLAGDVYLAGNGTIVFNGPTSYGGDIFGGGHVIKDGSSTLTLTGANHYGRTTLAGGTLVLGSFGAIDGPEQIINFTGGILRYSPANARDYSAFFAGTPGQEYRVDTAGRDVTYASALTSPGGTFIKDGAGTLTLAADSTYTGTTTVLAGVLQLGNGGSAGNLAASVQLQPGTALVFNRSDVATFSQNINGPGPVTKAGSGTLTLSGDNEFGDTILAAGTLVIGHPSALGFSDAITFTGGTLRYSAGVLNDYSSRIAGSSAAIAIDTNGETITYFSPLAASNTGGLTKSGAGTLILSTDNAYSGLTTIAGGTLQLGDGGSTGSVAGNIFTQGTGTLRIDRSGTSTLGNAISGTGKLMLAGSGLVTVTGNNTYSGGTIIDAGVLELGSAEAIGSAGEITFAGGILRFTAANTTDYAARFGFNQQYRLDTNGQNVTLDGRTLNGLATALEKLGLGTLSTTRDHFYEGATDVRAGTLQLGNGGATGFVGGVVNIDPGATLAINRSGFYSVPAPITNQGALTFTGGGTLYLAQPLAGSGTTTIHSGTVEVNNGGSIANSIVNHGSLLFNRTVALAHPGNISGSGTLTKAGFGTVSLSGENTYTGATLLNDGILALGHPSALGSGGAITFAGGALRYNNGAAADHSARIVASSSPIEIETSGQSVTYASPLAASNTAGLTKSGPGTLILAADNPYAGTTTISGGSLQLGNGGNSGSVLGSIVNHGGLVINRSGTFTLTNPISGSGSLTNSGSGIVVISGSNNYTGGTILDEGSLELGSPGAIANVGTVSFTGGILRLSAANTTDYSPRFSTAPGQQYRIDTNGQNARIDNRLSNASASLEKLGAGTLVTANNHALTGVTLVSGGTLQLGEGGSSGSVEGPIQVAAAGALVFNRSGIYAPAGSIFNEGGFTLTGGGTLLLSGLLSGSGTTTIASGTLQVNDGGSISNSIVNQSALVFNRSTALTHSGVISGPGTLQKTGAGTLTLSADHTYSGLTTVSGGTLRIGNGGATGFVAGAISVASNSTVTFDRTGTLTYNGAISGGGSLTKAGSGTVIFTADHSYTGGTTVSLGGGSLQLGNGGSTGSVAGNITNNANVTFNRGDNFTYADVISGNGSVTKSGNGTLIFTGNHTYLGNTSVSSGTLQLGNGGSSGSIASNTISVASGATLTVNRSNDLTSGAFITGGGALTKTGAGTLTLTTNQTYNGGTSVLGGTLQFGNGGVGGFAPGNVSVSAGANVALNRFNSFSYPGIISGAGSFTKSGAGTLILTGDHTYTGGTTVTAGTLRIGDYVNFFENTTIGSIVGDVHLALDANVVFFRNENISFAGAITGAGNFATDGSGTLTLSGHSTYTGSTTLSGGGILELASADALGSTSAITFMGGTLRYTTGNQVDYSAFFSTEDQAFSIDTNGEDVTYASDFGTEFSGLMKRGAGTLGLSGTNALNFIEISAGTLAAGSNAALGGAQFIQVSEGAVLATTGGAILGENQALAGAGTISGGFTLGEGAILYPGGGFAPGDLTFSDGLTFDAASILNFDLGSFSDLIVVSGGLLAGPSSGQITLNLYDTGDFGTGTYTLFDYSAQGFAANFSPASFLLGDTIEGYTYSLEIVGDTLQLTADVVPEPATATVLLGGMLALCTLRRRPVSTSGV